MIQGIIIAIFFAFAVFYIGKMAYNTFFVKKGCGGNCKCGVDFSNIDKAKSATK